MGKQAGIVLATYLATETLLSGCASRQVPQTGYENSDARNGFDIVRNLRYFEFNPVVCPISREEGENQLMKLSGKDYRGNNWFHVEREAEGFWTDDRQEVEWVDLSKYTFGLAQGTLWKNRKWTADKLLRQGDRVRFYTVRNEDSPEIYVPKPEDLLNYCGLRKKLAEKKRAKLVESAVVCPRSTTFFSVEGDLSPEEAKKAIDSITRQEDFPKDTLTPVLITGRSNGVKITVVVQDARALDHKKVGGD